MHLITVGGDSSTNTAACSIIHATPYLLQARHRTSHPISLTQQRSTQQCSSPRERPLQRKGLVAPWLRAAAWQDRAERKQVVRDSDPGIGTIALLTIEQRAFAQSFSRCPVCPRQGRLETCLLTTMAMPKALDFSRLGGTAEGKGRRKFHSVAALFCWGYYTLHTGPAAARHTASCLERNDWRHLVIPIDWRFGSVWYREFILNQEAFCREPRNMKCCNQSSKQRGVACNAKQQDSNSKDWVVWTENVFCQKKSLVGVSCT